MAIFDFKKIFTALVLLSSPGWGEWDSGCCDGVQTVEDQREASVPLESRGGNDCYMEGYLQSLIDMHYSEFSVRVCVEDGVVHLSGLPANCMLRESIVTFVTDFPDVCEIVVDSEELCYERPCSWGPFSFGGEGEWLPQSTVLFQPLIADPRLMNFSVGIRPHDDIMGHHGFPVTFGDDFPLYRWFDVGICDVVGDLQVSIEAGVQALFGSKYMGFRAGEDRLGLFNADYYAALPITYAHGNFSYRFRVWHISSHLGDEFLVAVPTTVRLNPSTDAIDFFASYQLSECIRIYGGMGYVFHSHTSFPVKRLYAEYGMEVKVLGHRDLCTNLYWQPFLAMHFRNWAENDWDFDETFALGVEWSKLQGVGRKIRLFVEYHDGYSLMGQFSKMRNDYIQLRLAYGF